MTDRQHNSEPSPISKAGSRADILAAAKSEFADHGFAGARVDRIARTAQVNKAMIYYHFGSKRELYRTCLRELMSRKAEGLKAALTSETTLEKALRSLADGYLKLFARDPEHGRLLVRVLAERNDEVLDLLADVMRSSGLPHRGAEALRRGIEAGEIRDIDPRQAIISFVVLNVGYFFMAPLTNRVLGLDDPEKFLEDRRSAVVDLFLNGVRRK